MTSAPAALLDELERVNLELERAAPGEAVDWLLDRLDGNVAMACSFEDVALLDLVLRRAPSLEVILLDTGFLFPETLEFARSFCSARGVHLTVTTPPPEADAWPCGTARCCELRKVVPLGAALAGRAGWLTALKRVDGPTRAQLPVVGWDERFGLVKCNPLATWTDDDVAYYLQSNGLPEHPLWAKGYTSIGCAPVTRPPAPGESRRAGRWSGTDKEECGLHG